MRALATAPAGWIISQGVRSMKLPLYWFPRPAPSLKCEVRDADDVMICVTSKIWAIQIVTALSNPIDAPQTMREIAQHARDLRELVASFGEEGDCNCSDRSWYGEGHDSACPVAVIAHNQQSDSWQRLGSIIARIVPPVDSPAMAAGLAAVEAMVPGDGETDGRSDPYGCQGCRHPDCGRFYDENARRWACRAWSVDGACAMLHGTVKDPTS